MREAESANHPLLIWQEVLWLLVALLTPLFVNFWVEQQFEASKIWLLRTLVWALFLLWMYGWIVGIRPRALPSPIRNLGILLPLVIALATLLSGYPTIASVGSLDRANGALTQISYILLFWCVATLIDAKRSEQLLSIVVLTALPICLLGLAQAAGWQPVPLHTDARSPIITTLGRANFTGAYLALLAPLTLSAAQLSIDRWRRIGFGALLGLEVIVIALTQARAAWLALLVGIGALLWLQHAPKWSRRTRWSSVLGAVAALAGGLLLLVERGLAGEWANGGSIAARLTIWQASLRLLWPRVWLGYGADTLDLYFPSVYPPQLVYYQGRGVIVDRAHNWLLDWSLSYGVVATIIFCALVAFVLWAGWQRLAASPTEIVAQTGEKRLANGWLAACMAAIVAQLVGNLFLFEVASTAVLFWLLLAIVTAATTEATSARRPLSLPLWMQRTVLGIGALIAGWAIWQFNVTPFIADIHSLRGTQAWSRGDASTAQAEYALAATYQPRRAEYHTAVALSAAQANNFVLAEQSMREAIGLRPIDPTLYTQLARIYAREGVDAPATIGLAYDAFGQAIALAPTVALTHQQFADLAVRVGDRDVARTQAQQAVDLDATDGLSFGILGWSQLQAGNHAAAQSAFEEAVRWQPSSADFHLGLATAHYRQGDAVEARLALESSLLLAPDNPNALTLQNLLHEQ